MARNGELLDKILKKVFRKLKKIGRFTQEEIGGFWVGAAGEDAGKHSRVVSIRRGVLFVNVDDSSWLYELTLKKKELKIALGEKLKGKVLKDIRFRIGEIKREIKNGEKRD